MPALRPFAFTGLSTHRPGRVAAGLCLALGMAATPALADLEIETETKLRAEGLLGMVAGDIKSTNWYSGNRSKSVSKHKAKNAMIRMLAGSDEQVSIIRLDKGVTWNLMPKDNAYTEIELASLAEQFEAMNERMAEARGDAGGGGATVASDEACTLSKPVVSITETGKSRTFAKLKADQVIVTVKQTCELPERDQVCEIHQTWESWLARDFPAANEIQDFYEEFARQTKLLGGAMNQSASTAMLAGIFGDAWEAAGGKVSTLKGYPMMSEIQLEFGGENCQGLGELQAATADLLASAGDAGVDGAMDEAQSQARTETARQTSGMFGNSPLEKIAGAGVGRAAGEVVSGLFGGLRNMGKGKSSGDKPDTGREVVFKIRTEVKKVSTSDLPDATFEVPDNYVLRETPPMPF